MAEPILTVSCQHCGAATFRHTVEDCMEHHGENLPGLPDMGCVSNHCSDEDWFICPTCVTFHMRCQLCADTDPTRIQLCRFIGHYGHMRSERVFRLPPENMFTSKQRAKLAFTYVKLTVGQCFTSSLREAVRNEYAEYDLNEKDDHGLAADQDIVRIETLDTAGTAQWAADFNAQCSKAELSREFLDKTRFLPITPGHTPMYYIGDKQLHYMHDNGEMFTGPDGGYPHVWKCDVHNVMFFQTDK